jgi:uncharacterized membrane protein YdjX (TVP38/TMEM64 family)
MRLEREEPDQPIAAMPDVPDRSAGAVSGTLTENPTGASSQPSRWGRWLIGVLVALIVVALVWYGPQLWELSRDERALEAWVTSLGWWGPVALVALNAIQIVIAPIPGYVAQIAAGFLFGAFWGGVWANLGLLIGSSISFWLARFYGRPIADRLVGHERLAQWEHVTHSTSTILWFVLLLGPIGDIPYFLAGLAQVSFVKIFIITLLVRVPSTFVVAAAGAGVMLLTWWQVAILLTALLLLLLVFLRYQDQIMAWIDRKMQRRLARK